MSKLLSRGVRGKLENVFGVVGEVVKPGVSGTSPAYSEEKSVLQLRTESSCVATSSAQLPCLPVRGGKSPSVSEVHFGARTAASLSTKDVDWSTIREVPGSVLSDGASAVPKAAFGDDISDEIIGA